ncbi:hypothetical protein ACQY0O_001431 [Thecaphora frezii]
MLHLIKGLLLASLAVQAAVSVDSASDYFNVHLIVDGNEVRQCSNVQSSRFAEFNIRHVCRSTVKRSQDDMACIANGPNTFALVDRFVAACDAAQGNLSRSSPAASVASTTSARPTATGIQKS